MRDFVHGREQVFYIDFPSILYYFVCSLYTAAVIAADMHGLLSKQPKRVNEKMIVNFLSARN